MSTVKGVAGRVGGILPAWSPAGMVARSFSEGDKTSTAAANKVDKLKAKNTRLKATIASGGY